MYNLQTMREEFRFHLEGAYGPSSMRGISDAYVFRLLSDANNAIQASLKLDITREKEEDIANGTDTYTLPADRIGSEVEVRIVKQTASEGSYLLEHLTNKQMRERFNLDSTTNDSGTPAYWSFSNTNRSQIIVRPVPKYAQTDGLIFNYAARPEPMTRIYDAYYTGHATVTVQTLNNGSADLTWSGAPNADAQRLSRVEVGDEIGFPGSASLDGISSAADSAHASRGGVLDWYTIIAMPTTSTATLSEVYRGNDISSGTWISAQVSDIEQRLPGRVRFAPVYMALSRYLSKFDPQKAEMYKGMAGDILGSFDIEEPEPTDIEHPSTEYFSWMSQSGGNYPG